MKAEKDSEQTFTLKLSGMSREEMNALANMMQNPRMANEPHTERRVREFIFLAINSPGVPDASD